MPHRLCLILFLLATLISVTNAQDKSVNPGINKPFQKPDVGEFQGKFEKEGREAFDHRDQIVAAHAHAVPWAYHPVL